MYLSLHKSDEDRHRSIPPTNIALPRKTITNPHQMSVMSQYQNHMMPSSQRPVMNQGVQNSQLLYGSQQSNDYMMSQRYNQGMMKSSPYSTPQYDQKRLAQSMEVQKRPRSVAQSLPRQSYPIPSQPSGVASNDMMRSQQTIPSQGMTRPVNQSVMQQNMNYSQQNPMYMQRQQVLQSPYSLPSSSAPSPRSATLSNQSPHSVGTPYSPLSARQTAPHTLPTMDTKRPALSSNSLPPTPSQISATMMSRDPMQQPKSLAVRLNSLCHIATTF